MILVLYGFVVLWALLGSRLMRLPALSLGLGYSLCYAVLVVSAYAAQDVRTGGIVFLILSTLATGILGWRCPSFFKESFSLTALKPHRAFLIYLFAYSAFTLYQGAYIEVPSDGLGVHLFRIGDWLRCGFLQPMDSRNSLSTSTTYIGYLFDAVAVSLSPFSRPNSVEIVSLFNGALLTSAVYLCAYRFSRRVAYALLGVFLFQITTGVHIYSYFRYYSFAPGFLNMVLFFDCVWLGFAALQKPQVWRYGSLLALFFGVSFINHKQEALFIAIYTAIPAVLLCLRGFNPKDFRWFRLVVGAGTVVVLVGFGFGVWKGILSQGMEHIPTEYIRLGKLGSLLIVAANPRSLFFGSVLKGPLFWLFLFSLYGLWPRLRNRAWESWFRDPLIYVFALSCLVLCLCFFPPSATFLSFFFYDAVFYRLLYCVLFALVAPAVLDRLKGSRTASGVLVLVVLSTGFVYSSFFSKYNRGASFFRLSTEAEGPWRWNRALERVGEVVSPDCHQKERVPEVFADPITAYPMNYLLGLYTQTCYWWRCDPPELHPWLPASAEEAERVLAFFPYFLINRNRDFQMSRGKGHWNPDVRNLGKYYTPSFMAQLEAWIEQGRLVPVFEEQGLTLYHRVSKKAVKGPKP